jgi:hypothetical protein
MFLYLGADECALETIPTSSTMFIMGIPHDGILQCWVSASSYVPFP